MIPRLDARKIAENDPDTLAAFHEAATVIGFGVAKRTAPALAEAWNDANTPDGAAR